MHAVHKHPENVELFASPLIRDFLFFFKVKQQLRYNFCVAYGIALPRKVKLKVNRSFKKCSTNF